MSDLCPRILICDDDSDARTLISSSIAAMGYEIIEAVDGIDALEKCAKQLPDLIILDVMMPRMDGMEFLKEFRSRVTRPFIPVLMLTALDQVENRVQGLTVGADDYVTKPFHYRELQARIHALLRVRTLTEALRDRSLELEIANREIQHAQEQLLHKERELVTTRITGTAAHNLGQPLTTILLNIFILEKYLQKPDEKNFSSLTEATQTIKNQADLMKGILAKLQIANPERTKDYVGDIKILDLDPSKESSDDN